MNYKTGDIINARERLWRVDFIDYTNNLITATSIDSISLRKQTFYEPIEQISKANIPLPSSEIIGDTASNKLLIQAFKYSMLHGSAPLLSLQRSSVLPTNYQMVPVVMALNNSSRVRMLIADDVGLGKTIEAGLIATELMARKLVSRILVICPKSLTEQWQEALKMFFQIDVKVMSSISRRGLEKTLPPGSNPWRHYPFIVSSIDYAKKFPTRKEVLSAPWDLVIIDEAHIASKPHQTSDDTDVSMDRYDFAKSIAASNQVKNLLLLTATPHNGYTDCYASLLDMLDCNIVKGTVSEPIIERNIARNHVCQRKRADVEEWFKEHSEEDNPFPERDQKEIPVELNEIEKEIIYKLENYGNNILKAADKERHNIRISARWVVLHLHKRALSSPKALQQSLRNRLDRVTRNINEKLEGDTAEQSPLLSVYQAQASALDEENIEDLSDEEIYERMDMFSFGSLQTLKYEKLELEELIKVADDISPGKDSKLKKLADKDGGIIRHAISGEIGRKKVIVFTRYKDTLDYLKTEFSKRLRDVVSSEDIITIDGNMNSAKKREELAKFQDLKKGILIATDCISEGVNLQNMANQIIHYELPWNPNRLEQRNGRVDRYGQTENKVYIRTLIMNDTLDGKIFKLLIQKAERIRKEYGFAPPFFGEEAELLKAIQTDDGQIVISKQTKMADFNGDSTSQLASEENNGIKLIDDEMVEHIKNESFYGQTDIDLTEVRKRLRETEELIGNQDVFTKFVKNGLTQFGCVVTDNKDLAKTFKIDLTGSNLQVPGVAEIIPRVTFEAEIAIKNSNTEHMHIGHPVIRRLFELTKLSTFDDKSENYGRTAIFTTREVQETTALYHFLVRFSVGDGTIIEELIPAACSLIDGKALAEDEIEYLLEAKASPLDRPMQDLKDHLKMALESDAYSDAFDETVNKHLEKIRDEREKLKIRLSGDDGGEWMEGIDDVEQVSKDLIAIRLYEPVI